MELVVRISPIIDRFCVAVAPFPLPRKTRDGDLWELSYLRKVHAGMAELYELDAIKCHGQKTLLYRG